MMMVSHRNRPVNSHLLCIIYSIVYYTRGKKKNIFFFESITSRGFTRNHRLFFIIYLCTLIYYNIIDASQISNVPYCRALFQND